MAMTSDINRLLMTVERIGVGKNKNLGFAVLYHRGRVKLSTKYRVWLVMGDDRFLELDPSEWREKYQVIQEYKTDAKARCS